MDNVTHALAGALLAAAASQRRDRLEEEAPRSFRRAAFIAGVVTAELPDADLAYAGAPMGMGNLGYLLHHRGHTHTVLFAIAGALLTWLIILALQRDLRRPPESRLLLLLSFAGTLSHIALDYTNSYGVHPFWPIDRRWFYGDAVFIVEPWFWIVALPPLFFLARRSMWRLLCAALLAIIIAASWRVSMVGSGVALVLTIGAAAWTTATWRMTPRARVAGALAAWATLELIFFVTSAATRGMVREQAGGAYRDVVLSPTPGNPFCHSALLVRVDGDVYSASRATIAPVPGAVGHAWCGQGRSASAARRDASASGGDESAPDWEEHFRASLAELRALATTDCMASATLRFIRVPKWERLDDGSLVISDLRFGDGDGNFASVRVAPGSACPRHVPDWEFPRNDFLNAGS